MEGGPVKILNWCKDNRAGKLDSALFAVAPFVDVSLRLSDVNYRCGGGGFLALFKASCHL